MAAASSVAGACEPVRGEAGDEATAASVVGVADGSCAPASAFGRLGRLAPFPMSPDGSGAHGQLASGRWALKIGSSEEVTS